MNKFRAITVFSKSLLRHIQGSGELMETNHVFYEAERVIKEQGWEEEAFEAFSCELENVYNNLLPVIDEYVEYVRQGEVNEDKEAYYNRMFHKLGVDGRKEEIIKFIATHGDDEELLLEELDKIMKDRREEDEKNKDIFFNCHIKIANGENFDREQFLKASEGLKKHGLYRIALKALPYVLNCAESEKVINGYDAMFKFNLY